jgi:SAM-dependent methyltransferase
MSTTRSFDDLTGIYEATIDWRKRLANEEPFYRRLFPRLDARSVLDAACGTGRHAALFHSWGLRVEGADISPAMIARARADFGEPAGLSWVVRGFADPIPGGLLDVVVCVGNSLALAGELAVAQRAVGRMLAAVRPGGALVVQVLNLWHLPDGPCQWQKCKQATVGQRDILIVKGVHRSGAAGHVDLIVVDLADPGKMQTDGIRFLGLEADLLHAAARHGGAHAVEFFGGYQGQAYDRPSSTDLLMVAYR